MYSLKVNLCGKTVLLLIHFSYRGPIWSLASSAQEAQETCPQNLTMFLTHIPIGIGKWPYFGWDSFFGV